ncbi:MAG: RNA 2',3'-cyclic phosphodiesterase [Burkholderiales bacterium]
MCPDASARAGVRSADAEPRLRAFFALWPPEAVRSALLGWAQACRASTAGRLVRRENLHTTLAFLGEIDRSRLPELAVLAQELVAERFELVLDRVGYWSHNGIVYAAAESMPAPLSALAGALALRLAGAGFRIEERSYFAHVTLLRAARRAPAGVRVASLRWQVDTLALVQSVRSGGRLVYRPLERWTLAD